ncbi:unnamed protein product [Diamesa hyperborea]
MSKRNNQPPSNSNPKKQKLESSNNGFNGFAQPNRVGISNNRQNYGPSTSRSNIPNQYSSKTSNAINRFQPIQQPQSKPMQQKLIFGDDVWGDQEDDELFIIASQEIEKRAHLNQELHIAASQMDLNLSYSSFQKANESSSSTQRKFFKNRQETVTTNTLSMNQVTGNTEKVAAELFIDLDTEPDFEPHNFTSKSLQPAPRQSSNSGPYNKHALMSHNVVSPTSDSDSQKENPQRAQLNHLTSKLTSLNGLNDKLKKNHSELEDKYQTKEGEVQTLRREMKVLQTNNDRMIVEKLKETESSKTQWQEEKRKMEKQLVSAKAELDFQKQESYRLRINSSSSAHATPIQSIPLTMFKINVPTTEPRVFDINLRIFDQAIENSARERSDLNYSWREKVLKQMLKTLQSNLSQLQIVHMNDGEISNSTVLQLFTEAKYNIGVIDAYIKSQRHHNVMIASLQHRIARECSLLSMEYRRQKLGYDPYMEDHGKISIYQPFKLFNTERGALVRRVLAIYAIFCRYSKKFCEKILLESVFEDESSEIPRTFIQVLTSILNPVICNSQKLYDYVGLVASVATLLSNLSHHYSKFESNELIDNSLVDLLRAVLFCRQDNPLTMLEISKFLVNVSWNPEKSGILKMLCFKCSSSMLRDSENFRLVEFKDGTCLLQLYGTMLKSCFPQHEQLNQSELETLMAITANSIKLFRNTMQMGISEINFLSVYEPSVHCKCFATLSHMLVILVHLCLKHRFVSINLNRSKMSGIARNGILVLADLFGVVCRVDTVDDQLAVYNRMQAVYQWLNSTDLNGNSNNFNFSEVHQEAHKLIKLRFAVKDYEMSQNINRDKIELATSLMDKCLIDEM